jgi:hypothetical protein
MQKIQWSESIVNAAETMKARKIRGFAIGVGSTSVSPKGRVGGG